MELRFVESALGVIAMNFPKRPYVGSGKHEADTEMVTLISYLE